MKTDENMTPSRARVAVIRCSSYDRTEVTSALQRGIDLLGGYVEFAHPGEQILLKPNVLWGTDPARCIITHPEVLRATAVAFGSSGATLRYGDSPAGLPGATRAMTKCGYTQALTSLPVEAVSFDVGKEVDFAAGIAGKRLQIAQAALDADGIINLPKLKTHGLVRMTGAVKNCFGCIPGLAKGVCHARFPDPYDFSMLLVDIAAVVRPRLHIMDAVFAMEGNGPQSGTPKKLGVLLFSTDPVALDIIACRLIDLEPKLVPTTLAAARCGFGVSDPEKIDCLGDDLEPLIDQTFVAVREPPVSMPTRGLLGEIKRFFLPRPVIQKQKCTQCGKCVAVCPVKPRALSQVDRHRRPVYNYRRCIRCYCCQEVCPSGAIRIRQSIGGRIFPFVPYISLLISRRLSRRSGENH